VLLNSNRFLPTSTLVTRVIMPRMLQRLFGKGSTPSAPAEGGHGDDDDASHLSVAGPNGATTAEDDGGGSRARRRTFTLKTQKVPQYRDMLTSVNKHTERKTASRE
jgi:hypothetical protein